MTGEDYEEVLILAVERQLERHAKIRLLCVLGSEFGGYSAAAMWDDAKIGMEHPFSWERIAVATDNDGYRRLIKGFGFMVPGKVRLFDVADLDAARAWISEAE